MGSRDNHTVGLIGCGVVGSAIATLLHTKGYTLTGVADCNQERMHNLAKKLGVSAMTLAEVAKYSKIVFITTNDGAIANVAQELADAGCVKSGQFIIHMSGALTSEILNPAAAKGAICLSIHPLQSFASTDQAIKILPGSFFSIEGNPAAYSLGIDLVNDLGGKYFFIDKNAKPLYHAGACVVSNYLVSLIDYGTTLLEAIGIPKKTGLSALFPLIEGTLNNIQKVGIPQALTGPIARGDITTIRKHLSTLEEVAPDLIPLYKSLGYQTVKVAVEKGVSSQTAEVLREILK